MINIELYISSLLILFTRIVSSIELSVDECLQVGFRKSDLLCNRCEELTKFDLYPLKDSCLNCCQQSDNSQQSVKKYSSARIEVCGWKVGHYPQISAFIKSDKPKEYENLSVKYVRGAEPTIKLLDSEGNVLEELNIQKWDTNTIIEFLNEHIS